LNLLLYLTLGCCFFFFLAALYRYKNKNNGALPASIVVYRDGVGDGQVSYVQKIEVDSIKVN